MCEQPEEYKEPEDPMDPMVLAKRVSYLEEVVGRLVYTVQHMGMGPFNPRHFLEGVEIDPETFRLF